MKLKPNLFSIVAVLLLSPRELMELQGVASVESNGYSGAGQARFLTGATFRF